MEAICQRCGEHENDWNVSEARFHVREIRNWKMQLCRRCAIQVQMVLSAALQPVNVAAPGSPKETP